jgi:hypothetical protein
MKASCRHLGQIRTVGPGAGRWRNWKLDPDKEEAIEGLPIWQW